MISLSATDAVIAADLHPHIRPWSVLESLLSRLGLVAQSQQKPGLAPLYAAMQWDRQALVCEADCLKRKRRADPIRARVDSLYLDIAANQHLDEAAKDSLMEDTRSIYQRNFGKYQEQHTCEWFKKVHIKLAPASQQHLSYLRRGLSGEQFQAMKTRMTVCRCFPDIGLQLQGLPDMRSPNSIVEVKNRMYAEHEMLNIHRHADHAQLMVYLVLAELDNTFQQPLIGYLVEHMRVGTANMLRVEYRDVPCVPVAPSSIQGSVEAAGHMVVTCYSVQQAILYWNVVMAPVLVKFCQLAEKVVHDSQLLNAYTNAADKDLWFSQHI